MCAGWWKTALCMAAMFALIGCSSGEGGFGSSILAGSGVKGPLVNATVRLYRVDLTAGDLRGELLGTGSTDSAARIRGIEVEGDVSGLVLLEFEVDGDTIEVGSGATPVLDRLVTVVGVERLHEGDDIFATPLTTMAVDLAQQNADEGNPYGGNGDDAISEDEFVYALDVAQAQLKSTLGFGLDDDVDIFETPPMLTEETESDADQTAVVQYRQAVEAVAALATHVADGSTASDTPQEVLDALVEDLGDGSVDGMGDDGAVPVLAALDVPIATTLAAVDTSTLLIPGTTTPIDDIEQTLADEAEAVGTDVDTTALEERDIDSDLEDPELVADSDGDGVPDSQDEMPFDENETLDNDGDGIGNNADPDDDNDGVDDEQDVFPFDPSESEDSDGDGAGDNADPDDDNDGTIDEEDAFPFDPTESADNDGDQVGDNADPDDDNDGTLDEEDAFPFDASETADNDGDQVGDNADTDDDNDGVDDESDAFPFDENESADSDGDGTGDNSDPFPNNAPPTATNLPTSIECTLGETVEFAVTASDAEDVPTFAEGANSSRAQAAQAVSSGGVVSFTCSAISTDTCAIDVEVDDGTNDPVVATLTVDPQNVWFVDGNAGTSGDGRTWATAMSTPQAASDAADAYRDANPLETETLEIWVASHVYKAASDGAAVLDIGAHAYYGGFSGAETSLDQRDLLQNPTVLDGDRDGLGQGGDNSVSVVTGDEVDGARFDGFTVRNGLGQTGGAGMLINFSFNPMLFTIANTTFEDNTVTSTDPLVHGGALMYLGSDLRIHDSHFEGNLASATNFGEAAGGAISTLSDSVVITNSTFVDNQASCPGSLALAGAIYLGWSFAETDGAVILNSVFDGNAITGGPTIGRGGAIASEMASLTITNSTFVDNTIDDALVTGIGGAIDAHVAEDSDVIVRNSVFWGNSAESGDHVYLSGAGDEVTYSCVEGGFTGTGNVSLSADPISLSSGAYLLNEAVGGGADCQDIGSNALADDGTTGFGLLGLDWRDLISTTRGQTETADDGAGTEEVDAGAHYEPVTLF